MAEYERTSDFVDDRCKDEICRHHMHQKYVVYCTKCSAPCCSMCITEDHEDHFFVSIKKALTDADDFIQKLEAQYLPRIESAYTSNKKIETDFASTSDKAISGVKQSFERFHQQLTDMEKDLMDGVIPGYYADLTTLQSRSRTLAESLEQVKNILTRYKTAAENSRCIEKLMVYADCPDVRDIDPDDDLPCPAPLEFHPVEYEVPTVTALIGKFSRNKQHDNQRKENSILDDSDGIKIGGNVSEQSLVIPFNKSMIHSEILETIGMPNTWLGSLFFSKSNELWKVQGDTLYKLLEKEGNTSTLKKNVGFIIKDFAVVSPGLVIATDYKNKRIVKINENLNVSTLRDTAPVYPLGICVNNKQEIVVGLEDTRTSHVLIRVYTSDCKTPLSDIQPYLGSSIRMFDNITHLTQNCEGNYLVRQRNSQPISYLTCINSTTKKVLWKKSPWNHNILCDKYGNVIYITESEVKLLDCEGKFATTLLNRFDGIDNPSSFTLDKNGLLWIAQGHHIKIIRYIKEEK